MKVFGYSDDLVELKGSSYKYKEFDCFFRDVRLTFSDGTAIKVSYGKEVTYPSGWTIKVLKKGTAKSTLATIKDLQKENPNAYSDIFEIEGADVVNHRFVR